jgi:nucleoside-diphosphate-sugar epimerase
MGIAVIGASGMLGQNTVNGVMAAGHDVVAVGNENRTASAVVAAWDSDCSPRRALALSGWF